MGKIIFCPISKHLKLDFSMSHSDERSRSQEISPEPSLEGNTEIQPLILQDEVEGLLQNFSTSQKSALDKDELLARLRTTRSALKAVYEVEEGNSLS